MYLTYQMMIGALSAKSLNIKDYTQTANPAFRGVEVYAGDAKAASADILYIAPLSIAAAADAGQPLSFLCVCDGAPPSTLITKNCISIVADISVTDLVNQACRTFSAMTQWVIKMQNSVIAGEGVQVLLDLSRPFLKNPVILMDLTGKLLAHTFYGAPDGGTCELNSAHILRAKDFVKFRNITLDTEELSGEPVVCTDRSVVSCPTVKRSFKLSGAFCIYAVMPCCNCSLSQGLIDRFSLLCRFIEAYVKRGYPYEGKYSAFDSLLQDFLDGRLHDPEEISLRTSRASIPCNGLFDLYQIALDNAANQPLAYLTMALQNRMPNSYVSFYQKSIVSLNLYSSEDMVQEQSKRNLRIIQEVLGSQIRGIGVCNLFSDLSSLRTAFLQTEAGLAVGFSRDGGRDTPLADSPPVYLFEELYMDHILLSLRDREEGIYDNCFARQTLNRLRILAEQQNYNYIGFLYIYLLAERRPSTVSRQLHLHRNTVVYHIRKVEDALCCSLEDPKLRLKLILEITRYLLEQSDQVGGNALYSNS